MRVAASKPLLTLFFACLIFASSGAELLAQNVLCPTRRINWLTRVCNPDGKDCSVLGTNGKCRTKTKIGGIIKYKDCFCVITLPGMELDYVYDGGKWELDDNKTVKEEGDNKTQGYQTGDVIRLTLKDDASNVSGHWINDNMEATDSHEGHVGKGYLDLKIGDISNPQSVPVTIIEVNYQIPSFDLEGKPTGETHYVLSPGGKNVLVMDLNKGTLKEPKGSQIDLLATNSLWEDLPVVFKFDGAFHPNGNGFSLHWQQYLQVPRVGNKTGWGTTPLAWENSDLLLEIYPNPTTGLTHIGVGNAEAETYTVRVFDPMGRLVHASELAATSIIDLNLTGMTSGLYQVMVVAGKKSATKPLLIQE